MDEEKDRGQVLVLAAMAKESMAVRANIGELGCRAEVFDTGIGKVNAAIWAAVSASTAAMRPSSVPLTAPEASSVTVK